MTTKDMTLTDEVTPNYEANVTMDARQAGTDEPRSREAKLKDEAAKYRIQMKAQHEQLDATRAAMAELAAENELLKLQAVRAAVSAAKGVPGGLLTGNTQEEMEASADVILAWKAETTPPAPEPQYARIDAPGPKTPITAVNPGSWEDAFKPEDRRAQW